MTSNIKTTAATRKNRVFVFIVINFNDTAVIKWRKKYSACCLHQIQIRLDKVDKVANQVIHQESLFLIEKKIFLQFNHRRQPKMIQNSITQWRKKASNPFIFDKKKFPSDKKSLEAESNSFLLVNTKPFANEHLPFPKDFQYESCFLPSQFEEFAEQIRNFKVREDDIWVLSYPKSGSTWVQYIVEQLKHEINATKEPISLSDSLYLEEVIFVDEEAKSNVNPLEKLDKESSPRIIKSHLPPNLLPIELWTIRPKIIYIARNPKDVAVSMFQDFKHFTGTIDEFFVLFVEDRNWYAPFHAHVITFWQLRDEDYFMFLTYEELSAHRFTGIKRISEFLRCSYGEDELKLLTDYVAFENMQKLNKTEVFNQPDQDSEYRSVTELKHFNIFFFTKHIFEAS